MLATFKLFNPEIERLKKIAKKHQTIIACAATAAVTYQVTHNYDYVRLGRVILAMGNDLDVVRLREALLRDFVASKNLKNEFLFEFIPNRTK